MTTTISEIADQRRLYETIEKRHSEAMKQEQIRMARVGQPSGVEALLLRARRLMGGRMASQPALAASDAVAEVGLAKQPVGSVAGH